MANKFAIIGVSGIALCAICLTGAALLGGRALTNTGLDFGGWNKPRCDSDGATITRQIAWDGSDRAEVEMPADVHYHQGQGTALEVKGPSNVVSQVQLHNGRVRLACRRGFDLDITLPGRVFREFVFHGAGDATLDGIDQPDLTITKMGVGDLAASGKTDRLDMTMMGAGDVNAGNLMAGTVKLTMMGAGDAEISPIDRLTLTSMGAGDVTLRHEPKQIDSSKFVMLGAGTIIHAGTTAQ